MKNWSKDQRVSIPIIIGNVIMLLLITIVTISGISGLRQIAKSNTIAIEKRSEMADLRLLQIYIQSMEVDQLDYLLNGDPVNAQSFQNAINPLHEIRSKIRETILTEDERLNLNIIDRQTDQYIELFTESIIPAKVNQDIDQLNILKAQSDELISQIDPFIQNMIADYEMRADVAYQDALASKIRTERIVVISSILAVTSAAVTGVLVARAILRHSKEILSAAEQLKKSESALKESERFLNNVIEHIPNTVFVKEVNGFRYVKYNRFGADLIGLTPEDVYQKTDYEIYPKSVADIYRKGDLAAISSKKIVEITEEIVKTKKLGARTLHTIKVPILDETGDPKYVLGISEDISERKEAEEKIRTMNTELEERVLQRTAQLEQTNKELEAFSYSISHDLRSPLRAINGYATIILHEHFSNLDEETRKYFKLIQLNAEKMGNLVDGLLNFVKLGRLTIKRVWIQTNEMVNEIIENMKADLVSRKITITVQPLENCYADEVFLRQVFSNLISNAVKFTREQQEAEIVIGSLDPSELSIEINQDEDQPVYFIKDNGIGFDMKYYSKLFGVFQRLQTDDIYEGTGLGLAITNRIIEKHGGKIWAESTPGEGTTFFFSFGKK